MQRPLSVKSCYSQRPERPAQDVESEYESGGKVPGLMQNDGCSKRAKKGRKFFIRSDSRWLEEEFCPSRAADFSNEPNRNRDQNELPSWSASIRYPIPVYAERG